MFRFAVWTLLALFAGLTEAQAEEVYFPPDPPNLFIPRAYPTGIVVLVPPYRHAFQVRIFTTPQRSPYYNVPPYPVLSHQ